MIDDGKLYRAPETQPLLPCEASRRPSGSINQCTLTPLITTLVIVTTIAIFVSVFPLTPLTSCNDPLDLAVRDRVRKEWDVERRQHQREVQRWMRETEKYERRENQQRDARQIRWEREEEEHRRYLEKRQKREEEERQRMNMFWIDPKSHTCISYGTREHTAPLVNVPACYDRCVEACMATPIQVHGVEYKAKWCEDHVRLFIFLSVRLGDVLAQGPSNVIGHWEVEQHELDCEPYWNRWKDWVRE